MSRFDGVLTDIDGTLIDSEALGKEAFLMVGRDYGLNISSAELDATAGWSAKKRFAHFRDGGRFTAGAPETDVWLRKLAVYAAMHRDRIDVLPGVPGFFRQMARSGVVMAAVTNSRRATAVTKISPLGEFVRHLRFTITADDVRHPKPDPQGYLKGANRLGISRNRLLVLEDSKAGVEAAHRAGIACIQIQSDPAAFSDRASLRIDSLGIKRDHDRVMAFMGIRHELHSRPHLDQRISRIGRPMAR